MMISINSLSKSFGDKKVLDDVSVDFDRGLNFIIGSSGSGKTTLLKILGGMDKNYDGNVFFRNKLLKEFTQDEINNYYHNCVGFIWQKFNLLDDMTVEENIEVALNIGNDSKDEINGKINEVLKKLEIEKLKKVKVKTLSGGQKQRVAIARALVKNPEIIIADEPTGALDKKSSKVTMDILKNISKDRLVIVVTHDRSLIEKESNVYELYKGTIVTKQKAIEDKVSNEYRSKKYSKPFLNNKNGASYTIKNFKSRLYKNILTSVVIALASLFLVINLNGEIVNKQQKAIDDLVEQRGDSLRDITVSSGRMNTFGSDENTAFEQDVSDYLYEYSEDERIENFLLVQFINDIKINIPGIANSYEVDSMGTSPKFDKIVEGKVPSLEGREVAISSLLVENLGLEPKDVIGKTINVSAWTYDEGETPRSKVDLQLDDITIVGVVDSTINLKNEYGQRVKTDREDSMFFSLEVINQIKDSIASKQNNATFLMRVKNIKDIMPIVEEFNSKGIITIGEFEDVQDILKISDISSISTKSITNLLAIIGLISVGVISIINYYLRRYEYAVLKVNGYSKASLFKLNLFDGGLLSAVSAISLIIVSIPINFIILPKLNIQIDNIKSIVLAVGVLLILNLLSSLVGCIVSATTNIESGLMKGER